MAALGHPSMPWQQHVNAVANEVTADGGYRYSTIVLTVPRQAGKTTLLGGVKAHRCMTLPDFRAFYTAQTGQAARDTWYEWQRVLSARMPGRWRFRLSNGEETARWDATGGFIRAFPPTPDSLHGKQSDLVALDEVWSFDMERGNAITQAVVPTQATRGGRAQLWVVSTAGTASSDWMRGYVDRGRASLDDPDSKLAYFEWSAPDDSPHDDPETWARFHPAYGHTISDDTFRTALEQMGEDQFRRGFLNQWPAAATSWRQAWAGLRTGIPIPPDAPVFIAADAPPQLKSATVAAAGIHPDGSIGVEVIDHRGGVEWVLPRLVEIQRRHRSPILIARQGPLGYLIEELQRAGVNVIPVNQTEYSDAVARFQTLVVAGNVIHPNDELLNIAVAGVQETRTERPTWRRKDAALDISPLVAGSLAAWQAANPPVKPRVIS
jgi:phage terminase large subunit-like protein